ncbi:hypothetical protein ACH5RR_032871 [Cinchona calisaya]|uniref:Uncharacterized protein n=1 Tax=Cinchona calisaya TaxID=153742 RepID=A0ABD2YNK4_9GENT
MLMCTKRFFVSLVKRLVYGKLLGVDSSLKNGSKRSEDVTFDNASANGSIVAIPFKMTKALEKDNSIISISNEPFKVVTKKGKASLVISRLELREKPKSKERKGRSDNGFDLPTNKAVDDKYITILLKEPPEMVIGNPITKLNGNDYNGPRVNRKFVSGGPMKKANSIWSDSEVRLSPSEVAVAMVERKYLLEENRNSVLDGWSLDESIEGPKSNSRGGEWSFYHSMIADTPRVPLGQLVNIKEGTQRVALGCSHALIVFVVMSAYVFGDGIVRECYCY